jgi:hypothetical protein
LRSWSPDFLNSWHHLRSRAQGGCGNGPGDPVQNSHGERYYQRTNCNNYAKKISGAALEITGALAKAEPPSQKYLQFFAICVELCPAYIMAPVIRYRYEDAEGLGSRLDVLNHLIP